MKNLPEKTHSDIRELYEYWQGISPSGKLPGRQHFDPINVPGLLPDITLIEVRRNPKRFWNRLVGSRIEEYAGESLTGRWFAQRLSGKNLRVVHENLNLVLGTKQPHWRRGRPRIRWEKELVDLERLYLPLARDGETVDMILMISKFSRLTHDQFPNKIGSARTGHAALFNRGRRFARRKLAGLIFPPAPVVAQA